MLHIMHRVNDVQQLRATPPAYGVEMDVHAHGERLVVHHEPGQDAVDLDDWLDAYGHAFLIANVKEEGIERRVRDAILAHGIEQFFLLDLSFPALVKMTRGGEPRVAVRVSEYEAASAALRLAGRLGWVWLDSFEGGVPVPVREVELMRDAGLKICVVSPELHGRNSGEIDDMKRMLPASAIDAVCTKYPEKW